MNKFAVLMVGLALGLVIDQFAARAQTRVVSFDAALQAAGSNVYVLPGTAIKQVAVFRNGLRLKNGVDYVVSAGRVTLTFWAPEDRVIIDVGLVMPWPEWRLHNGPRLYCVECRGPLYSLAGACAGCAVETEKFRRVVFGRREPISLIPSIMPAVEIACRVWGPPGGYRYTGLLRSYPRMKVSRFAAIRVKGHGI